MRRLRGRLRRRGDRASSVASAGAGAARPRPRRSGTGETRQDAGAVKRAGNARDGREDAKPVDPLEMTRDAGTMKRAASAHQARPSRARQAGTGKRAAQARTGGMRSARMRERCGGRLGWGLRLWRAAQPSRHDGRCDGFSMRGTVADSSRACPAPQTAARSGQSSPLHSYLMAIGSATLSAGSRSADSVLPPARRRSPMWATATES